MNKVITVWLPIVLLACPVWALERANEKENLDKLELSVLLDQGDGEVLAGGSEVSFSVRVSHDSYVILYNLDSEGRVHLLYPEGQGGLRRLRAGEILSIPESGPAWKTGSNTGMEFVQAVATTRRDLIDENELYFLEQGDAPQIVRDPFLALNIMADRLIRSPARNREVAFDYTFFYINERVSHPKIACPAYSENDTADDHSGGECGGYSVRAVDLYQDTFPYRAGWEAVPIDVSYRGSDLSESDIYALPDTYQEPVENTETIREIYVVQQRAYNPVYYPSGWGIHLSSWRSSVWWGIWWGDPWYYYPTCYSYYPYSWYGYYHWGHHYYSYNPYYCKPYYYGKSYCSAEPYRYKSYTTATTYKKGGSRYKGRSSTATYGESLAGRTTRTRTSPALTTVSGGRDRYKDAGTRSGAYTRNSRSGSNVRSRTDYNPIRGRSPSSRQSYDSRRTAKSERFRSYNNVTRRSSVSRYTSRNGDRSYSRPYVQPTRSRPTYQRGASSRYQWKNYPISGGSRSNSSGYRTRTWSPSFRPISGQRSSSSGWRTRSPASGRSFRSSAGRPSSGTRSRSSGGSRRR